MSTVPTKIDVFRGINRDTSGATQLLLGEAEEMVNFRITDSYKLKKLCGYAQLFASLGTYSIKGMWYGAISGTYHFLFACNGHIYEHNLSTHANTDLGTLTDDATSFFLKNNTVYILNGHEYYKRTGSGSISVVTGYRPLVAINAPPGGGGTLYEPVNLLTGAKHQTFSTVAGTKEHTLAESGIGSVDFVKLNGVVKTVTTDYTVNLTTGKVTLVADPGSGEGNLDIGWTKANATNRAKVTSHKFIRAFGNNDERIFLFGNSNIRIRSGIPVDGSNTAEYFEEFSEDYIGSGDAITDIVQQYDRQIIYTKGGAYYSYQDDIKDATDKTITSFPVYPLNNKVGNVAIGQAQLVLNNPFTIYNGLYKWESTTVRDERNVTYLSKRVQLDLDNIDLSTALTYDYEKLGEYWLCVGKDIWVYNYKTDVWYKFTLLDTPTCFLEADGEMYFGTTSGQVMKFDEDLRSFNGSPINAEWYMGFYDATAEHLRKYLNYTHISLKPDSRSRIDVYWDTNKTNARDTAVSIGYNNIDFDDIDFDDFSFTGNYNPQPFRIKTKSKKWVYFRLILKSNSDRYTAHVLSINLIPTLGGISK